MIKFKETIYYETEQVAKINQNGSRQYSCPKCTGLISWDRIPCLESNGKCLTIHNGYICNMCKTQFEKVKAEE